MFVCFSKPLMVVCVFFKTFAATKVLLFFDICKKNKIFFKNNSVFYFKYPFPHTHYDRFDSPLFFPGHAMPVLPLLPITDNHSAILCKKFP